MTISSHSRQLSRLLTISGGNSSSSFRSSIARSKLSRRRAIASIGAAALGGLATRPWHASTKSQTPRIAVIGAGLAGLAAAYYLKEAGYSANVFEGLDRVGGRVHTTEELGPNAFVDLGAELVNEDHYDVHRLAKRFNLKYFDRLAAVEESKSLPDQIYLYDGERLAEADLIRMFSPLSKQVHADAAALENDYEATASRIDELSIVEYLHFIKDLPEPVIGLIEASTRSEYGTEMAEASALQLLYSLPTTTEDSFDLVGGSDESYVFAQGSSSLPVALHQFLANQVQFGSTLSDVTTDNKGRYQLKFSDGQEVEADYVVLTGSPPALRNIQINLPLPDPIQQSINEGNLGQNEKIIARFNGRPWQESKAFQGGVWSNQGFATAWDATTRIGEHADGALTFFLGGDLVHETSGNAEDESRRLVSLLDGTVEDITSHLAGGFVRTNWQDTPLIGGSYSSFRPGEITSKNRIVWIEEGRTITSSVRAANLFFAGEYWSESYNGFMNGAIETGRLTATTIINEIDAG